MTSTACTCEKHGETDTFGVTRWEVVLPDPFCPAHGKPIAGQVYRPRDRSDFDAPF